MSVQVGRQKAPAGSSLSVPRRTTVTAKGVEGDGLGDEREPQSFPIAKEEEQTALPAEDGVAGVRPVDQVAPSGHEFEVTGSGDHVASGGDPDALLQEAETQDELATAISTQESPAEAEAENCELLNTATDGSQSPSAGPCSHVINGPSEPVEQIKASNVDVLPETVKREVLVDNPAPTLEVPLNRSSSGDFAGVVQEKGLSQSPIEGVSIHDKQVQDEARRDTAPKMEDQLEEVRYEPTLQW